MTPRFVPTSCSKSSSWRRRCSFPGNCGPAPGCWHGYADGAGGLTFGVIRLAWCLLMVFVPALALGATFPMAVRWFASRRATPARSSGALYALNTTGAALGAVLAGFVLVPAIGISGSTAVAMAGSLAAAGAAWAAGRRSPVPDVAPSVRGADVAQPRGRRPVREASPDGHPWLAAGVLGLSGFAALVHEIAWTRILALVLGPTTYAFAAVLAAVVTGVALGSAAGAALLNRVRRPAAWLAGALALAAVSTACTYLLAGDRIPSLVAREMATAADPMASLLRQGAWLTAALVVPTAACLGAAFPLALALAGDAAARLEARFGAIYAVNTVGSVAGSLAAGFVLIPALGLRATLQVACACLVMSAVVVAVRGAMGTIARAASAVAAVAAALAIAIGPSWDRELLASGPYMYAPFVPADLDLDTMLRAGSLLYYREGAAATVSVKRLTGTTTLAVDGKVDASNRGDMLTQKLVAHLPLLLHPDPQRVAVIGLGSGVTAGAVLAHPVAHADVIEISPEVIEASRFFARENHEALADPRVRLIVGDGRSHLLLSRTQYDVIVSEPSNPWIAGVAALFTREYFETARARLAPGGVFCQWANAYNISDEDLRSIAATFLAAFPHGTLWLVGGDDVLMVASDGPLDTRLAELAGHMQRPGVAADLADVAVHDAFSLLSLYVAGPAGIARYAAEAPLLTDDTMRLEFSAPRELHHERAGGNVSALTAVADTDEAPLAVREATARAGAAGWRNRGLMMAASDVHARAYEDFVRALSMDVTDAAALEAFVRTATLTSRAPEALVALQDRAGASGESGAGGTAAPMSDPHVLVAISTLQAAAGLTEDAVDTARRASRVGPPGDTRGLEQVASLLAESGNTVRLDETVAELTTRAPDRAPTLYYAAVAQFLHGNPERAFALAGRAIDADATFAPTYDLAGAAALKLDRPDEARKAFQTSLTFDAHDSAAYTNLGLLELAAGNRAAARGYFAEALWLVPQSRVAREGLARSR
ncbi:MAG: fused MFS/spermidine synthase [Vicinamibacterales bacterium]